MRDPRQYVLEGRYGVHDECALISYGDLSLPTERSTEGDDVTDLRHHDFIQFSNVNVSREYRVWFLDGGGTYI